VEFSADRPGCGEQAVHRVDAHVGDNG